MKFEPRVPPEGINTSEEHPLREMLTLVAAVGALLATAILIAILLADHLVSFIPIETEQEWFGSMLEAESTDVDNNIEVELYLQQLTDRLIDDDHRAYRFDVSLIESETPNAFIMIGGNMFITSGLLETIDSENALAMVIAHEIAHQFHRHPIRSLSRGILLSLILAAISGDSSHAQAIVGGGVNFASLAFSREQEREADRTGLEILIRHYGHSAGATGFFERISNDEAAGSEIANFFETHPGTQDRIAFLEDHAVNADRETTALPEVVRNYFRDRGSTDQTDR